MMVVDLGPWKADQSCSVVLYVVIGFSSVLVTYSCAVQSGPSDSVLICPEISGLVNKSVVYNDMA